MIYIDGSYGEGGGQILRTSLSLSLITQQPIHIDNIRSGRKKPGLAPQHLTCIKAAAALCNAQVHGDKIGSQMLEFTPNTSIKSGNYTFDVTEVQQSGSAGSVTLILQTILLPLALGDHPSQITIKGGTHVPFSPPVNYLENVYFSYLKEMGIDVNLKLISYGWYPQGGGEINVMITGQSKINGLSILNRGKLNQIKGAAIVTELPAHIPQRMASRGENLLKETVFRTKIKAMREKGRFAGAGIFLTAEYEHSRAGFSALGKIGIPAEDVAKNACEELLEFHQTGAPIDEHLGDQLLLPMALAADNSEYKVSVISEHLKTNIWVIEKFGIAAINLDENEKIIRVNTR